MPAIHLSGISVSFPIFDALQRSLKRRLLAMSPPSDDPNMSLMALADLSLTVQAGQRLAILGGNGSGKTTLLRVIAGLIRPQLGQAHVQGRVGSAFSLGFGLHPEACLEQIAQGQALLAGYDWTQSLAVAQRILDYAGITAKQAQTAIPLTPPGIVARLSLAAALELDAEILVIDEILDGLDQDFLTKMADRLGKAEHAQTIVLLAERTRPILEMFCTQAVVMEKGGVADTGTLSQIIQGQGASLIH